MNGPQDSQPLVVEAGMRLSGMHNNSVEVVSGRFDVYGRVNGSVLVHGDGEVFVSVGGQINGSVSVKPGGSVTVQGSLMGSVRIADGAEVVVEPLGKIAGSLSNYGLLIVRGMFAGAQSGDGELRLEGVGYIKQPDHIDSNGGHHYRM